MDSFRLTLQELTVLSVLTSKEMYGYEINKELDNKVLLGSLYNVLKQLERKKLIKSRWGSQEVVEGARRKYYTITAEGSSVLSEAQAYFMNQWSVSTQNI